MDGRPVAAESVRAMLRSMPHRSPDGHSVWHAGSVGLGQGMLFTTPESLLEELPLTSESGRCTIAADARIDNRKDLSAKLRLPRREREYTDGELVLAAYEQWGEACVDHLDGDFAFAVWDAPQRKLFCARDHFGIRPLYYHFAPDNVFAYASEIKALLTQPDIPTRLNEVRLGDYLAGITGDASSTIYDGIFRLQAGHALAIDADGLRIRKYYELEPSKDVRLDWSDEAYEERFQELFEEAVRCRTRSAFRVGTELSGGLDSSYVTCVARDVLKEEGRGPLHTLSGIFEGIPECDERHYMQAVIDEGDVQPHFVPLDAEGPLTHLDDVYRVLDDGVVGNNHQISWALRSAGRDAGIRVLLDGQDGDYTVGHGRSYLRTLAAAGMWKDFVEQVILTARLHEQADHRQPHDVLLSSPGAMLRAYALPDLDRLAEAGQWTPVMRAVWTLSRLTDLPLSFYLKRYLRKLIIPRRLHAMKNALRARQKSSSPDFIAPAFAERLALASRNSIQPESVDAREEQRRLLSSPGFALGLEIADHYAAARGIELRHPFLDRRLVEFCLALPLEQSFRNGWTRWIMRKCMDRVAPRTIAWRVGKANLRPGFQHGLLRTDGDQLQVRISQAALLSGYVDMQAARELLDRREDAGIYDLVALSRLATVSSLLQAKFGPGGSADGVRRTSDQAAAPLASKGVSAARPTESNKKIVEKRPVAGEFSTATVTE